MDLVSVIVPIYNTGEFLSRCIESVLKQTYTNIQLLLINDGSTDNSLEIAEEYENDYEQIEVYTKQNGGVSSARNYGLEKAKGKYVFFLDSDDYYTPNYIENFMKYDSKYEFVGGGYGVNVPGRVVSYQNKIMTMEEYKHDCINSWWIMPSFWVTTARYSLDVIKKYKLKFDINTKCGEDVIFNIQYFSHCKYLVADDHCDYVCVVRDGSALGTYWDDRIEIEKKICKIKEEILYPEQFDWIKFLHWMIALDHYYEHRRKDKRAKVRLKQAINDKYFRGSIKYIKKNGTKDMKIAAICLQLHMFMPYKVFLKIYKKIKSTNEK